MNEERYLTRIDVGLINKAALARCMGISTVAVWKWFQRGGQVPAGRLVDVERLTGIPRERLRPDLFRKAE